MAKNSRYCKELMVKEIGEHLNKAPVLIVTGYKGLIAHELNELRRELKNISNEYLVVKDSMAKRAIADGTNSSISDFIKGEVGIVVDKEKDPTYSSKLLIKFSKKHEFFKIYGGIMEGEVVSKENIVALASLPSRDVLLGQLANVINAPIQGIASVLHGIISKFVYALSAVKDKKEEIKEQKEKSEK